MLFLQCYKVVGKSFGEIHSRQNKYSRFGEVLIRNFAVSSQGYRAVTYYDELGLHPQATSKEIKTAFYELSKAHHPDRNIDNPSAHEKFKTISEAYDVLSNPKQRIKYDKGELGRLNSVAEREQASHKFEGEAFYESRGSRGKLARERGDGQNLDSWIKEHRSNTFDHAQYLKKKLAHKNKIKENTSKQDFGGGGGGGNMYNTQQSNTSIKFLFYTFVLLLIIVRAIFW